jgi:hypothetical protein
MDELCPNADISRRFSRESVPAQREIAKQQGCEPNPPIKAIRKKCLDCCCGQEHEVRYCVSFDCPLWPLRMGKNIWSGRAGAKVGFAK